MADHGSSKKSKRDLRLNKPSHWYQALYDPQEVNAAFDHYVLFVLISAGLKRLGRASKGQHIFMLAQPSFSAREMDMLAKESFLAGAGRFTMEYVPVAAAYAMQRSTALVVSLGERHTFVSPVIRGELYHPGVKRSAVNGYMVTRYLKEALLNNQLSMPTVRSLKEQHARVCLDYRQEEETVKGRLVRVPTPSGGKETVSLYALVTCGESYFRPKLLRELYEGEDSRSSGDLDWENGLHKLVQMSIAMCPSQYHLELYRNILIEGEGSKFNGLVARLNAELRSDVHRLEISLTVCPRSIAWRGAALLSTRLQPKTLSREEYQHSSSKRAKALSRLHHVLIVPHHKSLSTYLPPTSPQISPQVSRHKLNQRFGEVTDLATFSQGGLGSSGGASNEPSPRGPSPTLSRPSRSSPPPMLNRVSAVRLGTLQDLAEGPSDEHAMSSEGTRSPHDTTEDDDMPHSSSTRSSGAHSSSHSTHRTSPTLSKPAPLHHSSSKFATGSRKSFVRPASSSNSSRSSSTSDYPPPDTPDPPRKSHHRFTTDDDDDSVEGSNSPRQKRVASSSSKDDLHRAQKVLQRFNLDDDDEDSVEASNSPRPKRAAASKDDGNRTHHHDIGGRPSFTVELRKPSSTSLFIPQLEGSESDAEDSEAPTQSSSSGSGSGSEPTPPPAPTLHVGTIASSASPANRTLQLLAGVEMSGATSSSSSSSSSDAPKAPMSTPPPVIHVTGTFQSKHIDYMEQSSGMANSETYEEEPLRLRAPESSSAIDATVSEVVSEGVVSSHALDRFRRYVLHGNDTASDATISSSSGSSRAVPTSTMVIRRALRSHTSSRMLGVEDLAPQPQPSRTSSDRASVDRSVLERSTDHSLDLSAENTPPARRRMVIADTTSSSSSMTGSSVDSIEATPPLRRVARSSASGSGHQASPSASPKAFSNTKKWKRLEADSEESSTIDATSSSQSSRERSYASAHKLTYSDSTSQSHSQSNERSYAPPGTTSTPHPLKPAGSASSLNVPKPNNKADTKHSVIQSTPSHLSDVGTDHIKARPELPPKPNLNLLCPTIRFHQPLETHIRAYWAFLQSKLTHFVIQQMKNKEFVEEFVVPRYQRFVHIKQSVDSDTSKKLVPDIFIELAWQSHMARPLQYRDYSVKNYNGKILAHSLASLKLAHELDKSELEIMQRTWKKHYNGESFVKTMPTDKMINAEAPPKETAPPSTGKSSKSSKSGKGKHDSTASSASSAASSSSTATSSSASGSSFKWKKIKSETGKAAKGAKMPSLEFDLAAAIMEDMKSSANYTKSLRKASDGAFGKKQLLHPRTIFCLTKAYEMFFYLLLKYGTKYNMVYFKPPPFLAMIWKAHMMAPQLYVSDVKTYHSHLVAQTTSDAPHHFEKSIKILASMGLKKFPKTPADFLTSIAEFDFGGPLENVVKPCPDLPIEILVRIFKKLPTRIVSHRTVCKDWAQAASLSEVWISHIGHDFPSLVSHLPSDPTAIEGYYQALLREALGDAVIFDIGSAKIRCGTASDAGAIAARQLSGSSSNESSIVEESPESDSEESPSGCPSVRSRGYVPSWHDDVYVSTTPQFVFQSAVRRAITKRSK